MLCNKDKVADIAKLLNVSSTYIYSVFNGFKPIPFKWLDFFVSYYKLNSFQAQQLYDLFLNSKKTIQFNLTNLTLEQKKLAILFNKKIHSLNKETILKILSILNTI